VGIGAIIGLAERLIVIDPLLVKLVLLILVVKSCHDVFFWYIKGEVPNLALFDIGISDIWAYNFALSFIVPRSCSIKVPLSILLKLTVLDVSYSGPTNSTINESL
jgi:hypothetical protein